MLLELVSREVALAVIKHQVPVAELPLDLSDALMLPLLSPIELVVDPEE
jgi:hypothetical protein